MRTNTVIDDALSAVLVSAGFLQKGRNWYWIGDDVIHVINLQRSRFGEQYYINICLWIGPSRSGHFPKENKCHLRSRAEELTSPRISKALDLDDRTFTNAGRIKAIKNALSNRILPLLGKMKSVAAIAKLNSKGKLQGFLIASEAIRFIGEPM